MFSENDKQGVYSVFNIKKFGAVSRLVLFERCSDMNLTRTRCDRNISQPPGGDVAIVNI